MPDKGYRFSYRINAKHNIKNNFLEEAHSHTFYLFFYVEFKENELINISLLKETIKNYFEKFYGKFINNIFPFEEIPPTIENMANIFYKELKPLFKQNGMELLSFELGDSPFGLFSISECEKNIIFPNIVEDDIIKLYQKYNDNNGIN